MTGLFQFIISFAQRPTKLSSPQCHVLPVTGFVFGTSQLSDMTCTFSVPVDVFARPLKV